MSNLTKDARYTKAGLISYLTQESPRLARCVSKCVAKGSFAARLPKVNGQSASRAFSKAEFGEMAYKEAVQWVVDEGSRQWGETRFARYMYREIKRISHNFKKPRTQPKNKKTTYGVFLTERGGYVAQYKAPDGLTKQKIFPYEVYGEAAWDEASYWLEVNGISDWGQCRWNLIKSGYSHRFTSPTAGVSVYLSVNSYTTSSGCVIEYSSWCVTWRDTPNAPSKAKHFGEKKWGGLDRAGVAANFFAAKKRAERTCSTLFLPPELVHRLSAGICVS